MSSSHVDQGNEEAGYGDVAQGEEEHPHLVHQVHFRVLVSESGKQMLLVIKSWPYNMAI